MTNTDGRAWERLTAANDDIDAQLIIGVLDDAGIEVMAVKDRSGYGDYLLGGSNPWAPVTIHVLSSDAEKARDVLSQLRSDSETEVTAPESGQGAPSALAAADHRNWMWIVALAIVVLLVLMFLGGEPNPVL